ncbi:T9SS type A sorting domain-containing protein [Marivirga sp. S37H4]|uniref:T9SS type A sorting domain-containing protein n=1 Tax=Marivirga aurantiaca TaxID=2802615 RepID=A0A934X0Z0_9BACT|nr:LamG-like jellyroll fold domain-containing protein [Marivirga aurantiaca]MBK6266948.1 T9SS type A sorting domain-containing protein [Marivirga aurantiaca]
MKKHLLILFGILISIQSYGQIPTANLNKEYLFTNGSLQNVITPGTNDLTASGSVRTSIPDFIDEADNALSLNGDSFTAGYRGTGTNGDGAGELTLSFWMKTSVNSATAQTIFKQYGASGFGPYGWNVYLLNGKVKLTSKALINGNAVTPEISAESAIIADGNWHHIVCVVDRVAIFYGGYWQYGPRVTLYLDNVSQATQSTGGASSEPLVYINPSAENVYLAPSGSPYTGAIDNIRLYNSELVAADRNNLFNEFYSSVTKFYVNKNATGTNSGVTWENAFTDLQTALQRVTTQQIWVAKGTYTPDATSRTATFSIPAGVTVYGGFSGTESLLSERDFINNKTILSGDLLGNDNGAWSYTATERSDNSFHVVTLAASNSGLDGVTVSDGHANGGANDNVGAGILKSYTSTAIVLNNCTIENNVATSTGAGLLGRFDGGGVTSINVNNCIFKRNMATLGASFYGYKAAAGNMDIKFVNTLFAENKAVNNGASLGFAGSAIIYRTYRAGFTTNFDIINCTFANNEDIGTDASMSSSNRSVIGVSQLTSSVINARIYNSIFWNNIEVGGATSKAVHSFFENPPTVLEANNSIDEDAFSYVYVKTNTSNADPLFIDSANGDYSLECNSPAIDAGDATGLTLPAIDLEGDDRILTTVDMGAYEFNNVLTAITAITKDITVQLDASGNAIITPASVNKGSGSVCGTAFTLGLNKSTFTCADIGANVVTLTATETLSGNSDMATATVTVQDALAPTVIANDITVQLNGSGTATITPSQINNGSNDNCTVAGSLQFSLDITSFDCSDLGVNVVTLSVEDASGNIGTATANVTVEDNVNPVAIAQNISIQIDATTGIAAISASDVNNGSSDNCTSALTLSLSDTEFTCDDIGVNSVTLTVEDDNGNQATATATVTVISAIDDEIVMATNPNICVDGSSTTITTASSVSGINYYLRNSSNNTIVQGPIVGTGSGLSFNTGAVNQAKTFHVFGETTPPDNLALDFDGINDFVSTSFDASFNYNNGYTLETWVKTVLPVTANYPIFTIANSTKSDLEIYIQNASNKLTVVHDRGDAMGYREYGAPPNNQWFHLAVSYDGTTGMSVYYDGVLQAPLSNTITQAMTKTAGLSVSIGHISNPAFGASGARFKGGLDDFRMWNVVKSGADILAGMNNCLTGLENNLEAYLNFNEGNGTIATDLAKGNNGTLINMDGNTDWVTGPSMSCGQICGFQMSTEITLGDDQINPTAIAQNLTLQLDASGNATLTPSSVNNGSTDNCTASGNLILSLDKTTFNCTDLGANTVTLTVEDASGNQGTSTATVTVVDGLAPVVVTQNLTIQLDASGNAALLASAVNNGSSDNCTATGNLTLSLDKTAFNCADLGANTVTLTVEDAQGNQGSANATITVEDNIVPTAIAQNITLQLDAAGNATLASSSVDNGSTDNCTGSLTLSLDKTDFSCADLGTNTVTLTVEDASGNASTATATVTVEDNIAPTVLTQNIVVNLDDNGNATMTAAQINNGSTDNCTSTNDLILSIDITAFTTADLGANTVTLTIEDANGNSSSNTATVTIEEKTNQTIMFNTLSARTYGDAAFDLSATASSTLPVSYSVISGPATVSGSTVSITGVGNVTIEASQAGDATFATAPAVQQSFTVNQAILTVTADDQSITFGDAIPTPTFTYSGFVNGETVSVLIEEPTISTAANANSDAGNYAISLSGGSAVNYVLTLVDGDLTISKADQAIAIEAIADKNIDDASFNVVATTTSGLALTYDVSGPATIAGTTITLGGTDGTVTVTVSQAGNINFNEATASTTFEVIDNSKQVQAITFTAIGEKTFGDAAFDLNATASSGLTVVYSSSDETVATINGSTVTITGAGSTTITATQPGDADFNAASAVSQTLTVNKASQTITFVAIEGQFLEQGSIIVSATASSGLETTLILVSGPATLTGDVVSFTGSGIVVINASQAGNSNYLAAADVQRSFEVATVLGVGDNLQTVKTTAYPNPAVDYITVSGIVENAQRISVMDLKGSILFQVMSPSSEVQLNMSHLKKGMYVIVIETATDQSQLRVFKN